MASWVIYDKTGLIQRAEVKELEYSGQWMGERYCIAKLSSSATIPFEIGDYITFRGEKFFLSHIPTIKKVSSFQYDYELRLDSLQIELEWVEFRDLVPADNGVVYPTPLEISFTGSVQYLVKRIQACLDAFYGEGVWTITIGVGAVNEEKNISISNASCWDALTLVDTEYNLKFFISGRNITISGNPPEVDYTFEYGKGNGLYEIERVSNTDKPIVTKLRVYGSTRNLDASYLAGESWNTNDSFVLYPLRLMLPSFREDGKTDYILTPQSLIDRYGIREASVVFDDIYPTIKGVTNSAGQRIDKLKSVTPVTNNEAATFEVTLNNLGFDLVDSFTTETPQLSMKTGTLQGYAFNIQSATLQNDLSWKLVLERNTITEGDTGNFTVPNIDLNAKAEDEFVLLGITMPQTYIDAAEEELYDRGEQYLSEFSNFDYIFKFNIEFDEIFLSENQDIFDALHEGSDVRILDTALHQYTTYISISSLSITYDESGVPKVTVTLDDNPQASSLEQLEGQVSNMESTVANGFKSNSALSQQYKKKLDKSVWDSVFVLHYDNPDSPYALTSIESKVDLWTTKEISAGGKSSGGGGGTGGLIQTVYGYSSLGGTFSDNNKNDTFNAYTINTLASRIGVLENTPSGIASLTVNVGTVSYVGTGTTDVTVNLPAYYSVADSDNRYLQLSGGAMSGDITMTGHALVWDDQTAYDNVPTGLMVVSVVNDSELGYSTAISVKNYYGLQIAAHGGANDFYIRGHNHTQWGSWYKLLHSGNIGSFALTPSNYTSTLDGRYVKKSGDTMTGILTAPGYNGNYLRDESASEFYIGSAEQGISGYSGLLLATYGNLPTIISSNGTIRLVVNSNGAYWANQYPLLHTGNYASYLDSRYARLNTSVDFTNVDCDNVQVYNNMSTMAKRLTLNWGSSMARIYAINDDGGSLQDLIIGRGSMASGALYYDASTARWGIGTASPAYTFDITGTLRASSIIYANDWIYSSGQRGIYFSTYGGGIYMTDGTWVRVYNSKGFRVDNDIYTTTKVIAVQGYQVGTTPDIGWYYYSTSGRIAAGLNTARGVNVGNLCVSNAWADDSKVPTNGIYCKGNIASAGEVSAGNASDRRLKKDISTLSDMETKHVLSLLNPVSFTWNEKAEELSNGRKRGIAYSFVADEFLSLLPNAGRKMWDEYDAIYTEQVVPYVVKGWQMHERRLSDHERRIQELEKENMELKRQLRRVA